jgi:hypothetical protein
MTTLKKKTPKENLKAKDNADNKRFLIIVALATLVLMLLMYVIFVG